MFLYRVVDALSARKVDYAIVGGFAVALHGAVRGTLNLDIILRLRRKDFVAAEKALLGIGMKPRLPVDGGRVFDFRKEYIRDKNLIAWSFYNPTRPSEMVDIIITHDLSKMKIRRVRSDGRVLRVLAKGDLISMKRKSGRPQDLEDIKALEELS